VVRFQGTRDFTVGDFENTNFVTVGTAGDDIIVGTEGDDRIFAGSGDDQVFGLDGSDEVHGGTGNDTLDGGPGGFDSLFGDEGNDTLTLATSNFGGLAEGGDGNDVLFGSDTSFGSFDHTLDGGAGDDVLNAGAVGSTMNGGTGADQLVSSAADDQMSAGSFGPDTAQDIFVFSGDGRWSSDGSFYGDTISDFEDGVDRIELRGTGLQYSDLTILNEDFQTTIISDRGQITLFESFDQPVFIDHNDFLFT
jgi:Ca2+-binding RTX toxin-like protein